MKLDIRNILYSMMEIEKLKLLFFDKDQYFIFQHLPRPIMFDKDIYKKDTRDRYSGNLMISHMEGFWRRKVNNKLNKTLYNEAVDNIKKKDCVDLIDERLLTMIEGFV